MKPSRHFHQHEIHFQGNLANHGGNCDKDMLSCDNAQTEINIYSLLKEFY